MPGGAIDILVRPDLKNFPGELQAGLESSATAAEQVGTAIGVALAAGTAIAAVGFKQAIDLGMEFQATLNSLQSVTQATDAQMSQISATAQRLGSDLTLPATSAADAAEVMLELAKGGLSVDEAMAAASGTIMLAAAAQISGAEAAQIQSAALNTFGLEAGDAGRVADVLANSANAASGEITDFADAMQQVGAVASQFGISIEDTSTALSLFANAGIQGSDAGTLLKSALIGLANPSKPAQKAMEQLSLTAFDAQGNFVGLESVFGQLREASERLTPEQYNQAAATVFGSDAVRLAGVAAGTTAEEWDLMSAAVSRAGGAQDVAAAKTKGLAGAIDSMNSQIETAQLQVFDAIAAPLEQGVRAATALIPAIGDAVSAGLRVVVATGETVGPGLAAAIASGAASVAAAGRGLVEPLINAIGTGFVGAVQVAVDVGSSYVGILGNIVQAVTPVAQGIGKVADAALSSDGALSAIGATFIVIGNAAEALSTILIPIGSLVGGLVSAFAALPGPIQTVAFAMLALRFAGPLLAGLASSFNTARTSGTLFGNTLNAVTAPARAMAAGVTGTVGALRQFGGEMRTQQALAAASGASIGRLGAAQAAYQTSTLGAVAATRGFTQQVGAIRAGAAAGSQSISAFAGSMRAIGERVPTIAAMSAAFTNAATGATRFAGAAGAAAAAGVGLRNIGSGLIGALGGPFGAAITAAVAAIGLFSAANRRSRQEAQEHAATVTSLADALKASGGAFNQNAREVLAGTEQFKTAAEGAKEFGVGLSDLAGFAIDGGAGLEAYRTKLEDIVRANTEVVETTGTLRLNDVGQAAQDQLGALDLLVAVVDESRQSYADFAEAVDEAGGSMVNGATSGSALKDAIDVLGTAASTADEKTRALNDALNALSGGQLSLEQSQARLNESLSGIGTSFEAAKAAADGAGVGFLNATGGINTTTEAGGALLDEVAELGQNMTDTAQKAFDAAGGFGNLGEATVAARDAAQSSYDAFVQAAQGIGLTAGEAEGLAARYGLIPDTVVTLLTAQGLDQVSQELLGLKANFDAVPGQKSITVQSLTDEARQKLAEIGIIAVDLPNGQVMVTALTEEAKARFGTLVGEIGGTTASFQLDANPEPANNVVNGTVTFANGQTGTVTIDGNQQPANGKITAAVQFADGSQGTITVDANQTPANGKVQGVVTYANGSTGTISVAARDLATPVINRLKQPTSSTHTIRVTTTGQPIGAYKGAARGGIFTGMHDGGVVGFAGGAFGTFKGRKLTPMATGLATVVKPNTWRVVGDRMRDDEAYIPINRSHRSQALLEETARRMGYTLARGYADGGLAARNARAIASSRVASVARSDIGVVAAINTLRADVSNLQRSVQVTNQFYTESSARDSDTVAKTARRQAALGMFG